MMKVGTNVLCRGSRWEVAHFSCIVSVSFFLFALLYRAQPSGASVPPHPGLPIFKRNTVPTSGWEAAFRSQSISRLNNLSKNEWPPASNDDAWQDALSFTGRLGQDPTFTNVTADVGIIHLEPSTKFGGPCVADLDGDGVYDLVLSNHNKFRTLLYFGMDDGTFAVSDFETGYNDVHGITAGYRTAHTANRMLSISVGGGRGTDPKALEVYLVRSDQVILNISTEYGLGATETRTRGRSTLFMDLGMRTTAENRQNLGGPDILVASYTGVPSRHLKQFAFKNVRGNFTAVSLPGFENQSRGTSIVTDVEDDQVLELVSIRNLQFFRLVRPFEFAEVTKELLPPGLSILPLSVASIVEFDFDNDGLMDLYVARVRTDVYSQRSASDPEDTTDILLRNVGGKYENVSIEAGIPIIGSSTGVTAGDFNNDGYVDLFVVQYNETDIFLINQGDGTFRRLDGLVPKDSTTVGNNAVAVDYDLDGRVDIIVGHGHTNETLGVYTVMKNTMPLTENNHYLLVRVGNEPTRAVTAMQAVVTVFVGGRILKKRVGSVGAQEGGSSYIDTLHFGLGSATQADCVRVQWSNRAVRKVRDVPADQKILIGLIDS